MVDAYDATDSLVGFARTLRCSGVRATPESVQAAVQACVALDPARMDDVYWAGRLTLCGGAEDLRIYDEAFDAYFGGRSRDVVLRNYESVLQRRLIGADFAADGEPGTEPLTAAASAMEQLRERDFGTLSPTELEELRRLLARFRLAGSTKRSRRWEPTGHGAVDSRRSLRDWLAAGGEPALLVRRRRRTVRRRIVLLVDVSGSMELYAEALLRFAHAATRSHSQTEVFAVGTRLTRLTGALSYRSPEAAMAAVAAALPDAGGGTRLGVLLKEFLDKWGQRGTSRGAVVVVMSDGWEQGDATLLGEQCARLRRLSHRVVWSNPRKAKPGYEPLAAGMSAALPHVDDFVEGHSLAALERLADVVLGRHGG